MAVQSRELRNPQRTPLAPTRPYVALPQFSMRNVGYLVTAALLLLAIYAIMNNVVGYAQTRIDDLRYGTPRTTQVDIAVGHNDATTPSHFIAMNLNRQVTVLQIPGGDANNTRVITGPYLVGAGEDKTPVQLQFSDVNGDSLLDMIINVKNEAIIFINRDGQFQAPRAGEQLQLP